MAFAAESKYGLSDEHYIKWVGRFASRIKGKYSETTVPLHRCSDEEFARFHGADNFEDSRKVEKL